MINRPSNRSWYEYALLLLYRGGDVNEICAKVKHLRKYAKQYDNVMIDSKIDDKTIQEIHKLVKDQINDTDNKKLC